jgi:hypothetical protein
VRRAWFGSKTEWNGAAVRFLALHRSCSWLASRCHFDGTFYLSSGLDVKHDVYTQLVVTWPSFHAHRCEWMLRVLGRVPRCAREEVLTSGKTIPHVHLDRGRIRAFGREPSGGWRRRECFELPRSDPLSPDSWAADVGSFGVSAKRSFGERASCPGRYGRPRKVGHQKRCRTGMWQMLVLTFPCPDSRCLGGQFHLKWTRHGRSEGYSKSNDVIMPTNCGP